MGFSPGDMLPADVAHEIGQNAKALAGEDAITRTVTWRHQSGGLDDHNVFTGELTKTGTPEAVPAIRGHARDSQTDQVLSGRYWYMIAVGDVTGDPPDTNDLLIDDGDTLTVNAVQVDPLRAFYRIDATKTTEA